MPAAKSVKLNTGAEMPIIGLGTWKSQPGEVEKAVAHAIKIGYRHIDTAAAYGNEKEVGDGIEASGVARSELFITTKLDNPDQRHPAKALDDSLKKLRVGYLDLWLMHWPAPMTKDSKADLDHDWLTTWKEMEKLYKEHPDKLRAIGVSNFSVDNLKRLLSEATVVPAMNQIELHPSCPQQDIVSFCREKGIANTAYSPLGSDKSPLLENEIVKKIATKYDVGPGNVLISLQANRGIVVIPKSVNPSRVEKNFKIIDLLDSEIADLHSIDKQHHFRAVTPEWTGHGHLGFPDRVALAAEGKA